MFIGHLPAGYILTTKLQQLYKTDKFLWLGVLASVLPDIDLLYFYFIDHRRNLHHEYLTHLPVAWLMIAAGLIVAILLLKNKDLKIAVAVFMGNIFLHLILDTVVGRISWLNPFSKQGYALFDVPDAHGFWIYNFLLHWTIIFEIALVAWAARLWPNRTMTSKPGSDAPSPSTYAE